MRTTLTIDDKLAKALRKIASESGRPFKEGINRALRVAEEMEDMGIVAKLRMRK